MGKRMSTIKITDIDEVRAGDKVTVETVGGRYQAGGDTVTATVVEDGSRLYVLGCHLDSHHIRFISAEREVPDVPTEPGAYADKDGDPWLLDGNGYWGDVHGHWRRAADAVQHGPFTRMVSETELAEQRKKIADSLRKGPYWVGMPDQVRKDLQWVIDEEIAPRLERGEF
jgi:hypothetical protein